jgi:zinc protease
MMSFRVVKIPILLLSLYLLLAGCEKMNPDGVTRTVLDNGMIVLVKERHSAPIVVINTWVNAGYFDEPDSLTGISHLLEHMFFKGTAKREVGQLREDTKKLGGYLNGGTIYEYTHYYTVLPARFVREGLELQSDALWNSVVDSAELEKEKRVVIQEVKRKLDNPNALAWEKLMELAFEQHPIRRWRMGTPEQIQGWSKDQLEGYFRDFYRPDNIILAIVGDVNTEDVLKEVERYYGSAHTEATQRPQIPKELIQEQLKFVQMKGDITQTYLKMGFHIPGQLDKDFFPLEVLAHVLGYGRSSRLSQSLREDRKLVTSVTCEAFGLRDFGVFLVEAELEAKDVRDAQLEIIRQIERIKAGDLSQNELAKAKNVIRFSHLSSLETARGLSNNLASFESYGDYRLGEQYLDYVDQVNARDVQRAATKYLALEKANILEYSPEGESGDTVTAGEIRQAILEGLEKDTTREEAVPVEMVRSRERKPSSGLVESAAREETLSCGATLITRENHSLPLVSLGFYVKGGRVSESKENCGITRLTLSTSLKGTENRSAEEIFNGLEMLGASANTQIEADYFGYLLKLISENLEPTLDIMTDVIKNPMFDPEELEKEKTILLARIERNRDSMRDYPIQLLYEAIFPQHPYGLSSLGEEDAVESLDRRMVRRWHEDHFSAENMTIVAVGDFDSFELRRKLGELFGDFRKGTSREIIIPSVNFKSDRNILAENRRKAQTAQALGFITCRYSDDDLYALKVLQAIASGTGGRFFHQLREKEGLAYTVYGVNDSWEQAGLFYAYIATSPQNEELAREKLLDEFYRFKSDPVTDEELQTAKNYISGIYQIYLETNSALVQQYAKAEILGKGIEAVEEYPQRIAEVTKDQVKEVSARYFDPRSFAVGATRGAR